MKRLLLVLVCATGTLAAAANEQKPAASVNPNDKTPNLGLDTQDTTDIFAIQLDSSEEADNLEIANLEEMQAKIQKKREMKQEMKQDQKMHAQGATGTATQTPPAKK